MVWSQRFNELKRHSQPIKEKEVVDLDIVGWQSKKLPF